MPTTTQTITDADCCCTAEVCSAALQALADAETDLFVDVTCAMCPPSPDCDFCFPKTAQVMDYQEPEPGFPNEPVWNSTGLCNNSMTFSCLGDGVYSLSWPSGIGAPITIPTTVVSITETPFMIVFTTSSFWFTACNDGVSDNEYEVTVTIYE